MNKPRELPELYLNRELGQLAFNRRVLAQAENRATPAARAAALPVHRQQQSRRVLRDPRLRAARPRSRPARRPSAPSACGPTRCSRRSRAETHDLVDAQYQLLNEEILPELASEGIRFLRRADFTAGAGRVDQGLLLPRSDAGADADRARSRPPLPARAQQEPEFRGRARRQGRVRPQLRHRHRAGAAGAAARDPAAAGRSRAPSTTSCSCPPILHAHVGELFAGMKVADSYQFRVTRNSELFVDEEEVKDLRAALRGELPHRQFGDEVRLEVADNCPPQITDFLLAQFNLGQDDLYRVDGPGQPRAADQRAGLGGAPGPQVPGVPSRPAGAARAQGGDAERGRARSGARGRHPAPPPVPVVPAGDRVPRAGGARPERGGDQDDGLPHRRGIGADGDPDRARRAAARK